MGVQELEGYIDVLIEQQIDQCSHIANNLEEIDKLPPTAWPSDEALRGPEMFIKGYVIGSVEELVLDLVLTSDDFSEEDYANVDTTPLRRYVAEQVEKQRDELRDALTPNHW